MGNRRWGPPQVVFKTEPECFRKHMGCRNMIEGSRIGMVLSQSAVPVALIPQVVSSTPAGLTGAGEAAHCRDSPYLGRAAELLQVAERPGGQSPATARVFRTKPDCVRNSRLGHPVHIFAEKQSHQVIENTELRPKIGQNKPNFGHFQEGDSKPRAGQVQQSPWYQGTRIFNSDLRRRSVSVRGTPRRRNRGSSYHPLG